MLAAIDAVVLAMLAVLAVLAKLLEDGDVGALVLDTPIVAAIGASCFPSQHFVLLP